MTTTSELRASWNVDDISAGDCGETLRARRVDLGSTQRANQANLPNIEVGDEGND